MVIGTRLQEKISRLNTINLVITAIFGEHVTSVPAVLSTFWEDFFVNIDKKT